MYVESPLGDVEYNVSVTDGGKKRVEYLVTEKMYIPILIALTSPAGCCIPIATLNATGTETLAL